MGKLLFLVPRYVEVFDGDCRSTTECAFPFRRDAMFTVKRPCRPLLQRGGMFCGAGASLNSSLARPLRQDHENKTESLPKTVVPLSFCPDDSARPLRPLPSVRQEYWQNDGGKIIPSSKMLSATHEPDRQTDGDKKMENINHFFVPIFLSRKLSVHGLNARPKLEFEALHEPRPGNADFPVGEPRRLENRRYRSSSLARPLGQDDF